MKRTARECVMMMMHIDDEKFEELRASGFITGDDEESLELHPPPMSFSFDIPEAN